MSLEKKEKLREACEKSEIILSDTQIQQLLDFYELLVEKNKVMNLTAITEFDEVINKHFIDSFTIIKIYTKYNIEPFGNNTAVLDLGTGGGFPGIPLKILYPETEFVLADSLNKRILFLQDVIGKLGLKKITAVHGRAEELGRKKEYREKFDFCVSRAVANLSSLSEYCLPFVKKGGYFVSYKSGNALEEIKEAKKAIRFLGGQIREPLLSFTLPDTDQQRILAVIQKIKATPPEYPRKPGIPGKTPLK